MNDLEKWFARAMRRLNRIYFLEEALLTRRYFPYFYFRLRYFIGITILSAAIHIIEFTIIAFIFSREALVLAILVRLAGSLGSAWWWGALEDLRNGIRTLKRNGSVHRIESLASRWMRLAVVLAFSVFVATVAWIAVDINRPLHTFTIFHLFVLAVSVQLALAILARTYHSIVYSTRRVYRPFTAILAVRAFAFAGTILVWPLFGLWSFPLVLILTSVFASALTFHYVTKMYRSLGFRPLRLEFDLGSFRLLNELRRPKVLLPGFAYASVRLDILLILLLFPDARQNPQNYNLFIFFYIISPFIRSTYGWAQLFYFDLKRLEPNLLTNLKKDFERFVRWMSWWVGVVFFVLACVIGTLIIGRNMGMFYLIMALFFVVRSRFAFTQIRLFVEQRYGVLIGMGALLVGAVLYMQLAIADEAQRFGLYATILIGALALTSPIALKAIEEGSDARVSSLADWIRALGNQRRRVRIRRIMLSKNASKRNIDNLSRYICRRIKNCGSVTNLGMSRIIWFEIECGSNYISDEEVICESGGLIYSIDRTEFMEDGIDAIKEAQNRKLVDRFSEFKQLGNGTHAVFNIAEWFIRRFPNGIIFNLLDEFHLARQKLNTAQCRDILFKAMQYSKDFRGDGRISDFDVSALLINGEICLIFALPVGIDRKKRRTWRREIRALNWGVACGVTVRT